MKILGPLLAISLLASSTAFAQEAPPLETTYSEKSGVELGARLGYGIPMGETVKDSKLTDFVSGAVPIILDAGYRFNDNWYAGVYFQYAFAMLDNDLCPNGATCSGSDIRYGIHAQYHLKPAAQWDPWVGVGIGYETLGFDVETDNADLEASTAGFEYLNLSLGLDYRISDKFAVGPFLTVGLGQYSESELESGNTKVSSSIDSSDKAFHEWVLLGVRGTFDL